MKLQPLQLRDFHGGRYAPAAIDNFLCPEHTVSDSLNVNFDTTIGPAVVRPGTTKIQTIVSLGLIPLGMANYVSSKGTPYNRPILANTGKVYYNNGTWYTSNLTNLSTTARVRFDMLGNQMFLVNGATFQSSSNGGKTWGTTNTTLITPGLIVRSFSRLLVSGDTNSARSPSRVYFSSVVDPTPAGAGTITWNTHPTTGDWIDINPDDGDKVTALTATSTYVLAFKNRAMYRIDVINKSVSADNICNIGTPSQEAVTLCQGIVYFFSGLDIRSTTGDFPKQISRLGVQDFIDAIPLVSWTSVIAGTDNKNVYFSIGNVTLNSGQDNQKAYTNVVLKFSPNDQAWSVHSYAQNFQAITNINTVGVVGNMIAADTSGNVQNLNAGTTDNTSPIFYELYTQELDMGARHHSKTIAGQMAFFTKFGTDSSIELYPDDNDFIKIPSAQNLDKRVTIAQNVNVNFNFLKIRWFGNSSGTAPVFQGVACDDVTSDGMVKI